MSLNENSRVLSEHESARSEENNPIGYEPTPEQDKAIRLVNRLFKNAKNARKAYDEKWLSNYRMFRGKQWQEDRPKYRHSEVINLIFRCIQSDVPILTDAMPKPEFIPTEPNDFELAQILNDVCDYDWGHNNWSYIFTEMLYDSHLYGNGFGSMPYDPDADNGVGAIKFKSADPFYQYPDPSARNINVDSRYHIEAEPVDIEILKARYPDVAQFIKADILDISRRDKAISDQIKYKSPLDSRTVMEGTSSHDVESRNEALEVCLYLKDTEICEEETKEIGEDGLEKSKYIQKLKYPNGRKIVVVNGVLCHDGENPYDDQKFPYFKLDNYILPREFWSMSEVEQLESPQKIFNKLLSFSLDVLTLMGNPIWVVDNDSGVDTDNLFNRPGLIVEKESGSEVRREAGVQIGGDVLSLIDRMKTWFDDISGSNDVSRGVRPEGVTAASAIEALQSAAQTRMRQKSKNIDACMQEFGQMYQSRVFQFSTAPKIYRITDNENATRYFKFHIDEEDELDPVGMPTGKKVKFARVRRFSQGQDGKSYQELEEKKYQIKNQFDVKISMGSALPFEKQRVEAQTFALFDRQIIDSEEVLKNLRYPNTESLLKRMAEKAQQAAMMQAQGQLPPQQQG